MIVAVEKRACRKTGVGEKRLKYRRFERPGGTPLTFCQNHDRRSLGIFLGSESLFHH